MSTGTGSPSSPSFGGFGGLGGFGPGTGTDPGTRSRDAAAAAAASGEGVGEARGRGIPGGPAPTGMLSGFSAPSTNDPAGLGKDGTPALGETVATGVIEALISALTLGLIDAELTGFDVFSSKGINQPTTQKKSTVDLDPIGALGNAIFGPVFGIANSVIGRVTDEPGSFTQGLTDLSFDFGDLSQSAADIGFSVGADISANLGQTDFSRGDQRGGADRDLDTETQRRLTTAQQTQTEETTKAPVDEFQKLVDQILGNDLFTFFKMPEFNFLSNDFSNMMETRLRTNALTDRSL